jgi:hypothetical protein
VNTFGPYVWNNWSWVIHTMSTWFWHKKRVWQWMHVSLLLNIHKKRKTTNYSPRERSLRQHATWPLAHIYALMCANGHSAGPTQEAPHGAQAVWNLESTYGRCCSMFLDLSIECSYAFFSLSRTHVMSFWRLSSSSALFSDQFVQYMFKVVLENLWSRICVGLQH